MDRFKEPNERGQPSAQDIGAAAGQDQLATRLPGQLWPPAGVDSGNREVSAACSQTQPDPFPGRRPS